MAKKAMNFRGRILRIIDSEVFMDNQTSINKTQLLIDSAANVFEIIEDFVGYMGEREKTKELIKQLENKKSVLYQELAEHKKQNEIELKEFEKRLRKRLMQEEEKMNLELEKIKKMVKSKVENYKRKDEKFLQELNTNKKVRKIFKKRIDEVEIFIEIAKEESDFNKHDILIERFRGLQVKFNKTFANA